MFDFSALLNDATPVSPILLPVDMKRKGRVNCWRMTFTRLSFFCIHHSDGVQWVLCLISMIRLMMLLLFVQCCCLLIWREKEKEWFVDGCHLCVFFLLFSPIRLRFVSVVFDFNASLNDVAPVSPILLPVDVKRLEKRVNRWWMPFVCLLSFVLTP